MAAIPTNLTFNGESRKTNSIDFLKQVRKCTINMTDAKHIEFFECCLKTDSTAEQWYNGLPAVTQADWSLLIAAFKAAWKPPAKEPVGVAEASWIMRNFTMDASRIGEYEEEDRNQVPYHKQWARELMDLMTKNKAPEAGAVTVRKELPELVKKMVPTTVATWKDLCEAVEKVDTQYLKERAEEERARERALREVKELTERAMQQAEEAQRLLATPTSALRHSMGSMTIGQNAPHTAQTAVAQQLPNANPFIASAPMHPGNLFYNANQSTMQRNPRRPEERYATMKANLPIHHEDTEAGRRTYQAQLAKWLKDHREVEPNEYRPFPLKPGTQPLGSRECYRCGQDGHTGQACIASDASHIPDREGTWRARARAIMRNATTAPQPMGSGVPMHYVIVNGQRFIRDDSELPAGSAELSRVEEWVSGNE
ncbi:hypothetical protein OBBRIDRAFT_832251 [Obba rivulosa]|uniref:CCHC-type domain-containing protein n=1 Tax=Obba rivulosa TaxID=1052685 RepID=A0A8E2DQL3_9APHY|nr:hypothetical protein OBBRIDRAFT_832251 [Obba rivulosa]